MAYELRPCKVALAVEGYLDRLDALLLRHELMSTLTLRGEKPEWADIVRDLPAVQEIEVEQNGRRYRLRLPLQGVCGKLFQAVGGRSALACPGSVVWCQSASMYTQMPAILAPHETDCRK